MKTVTITIPDKPEYLRVDNGGDAPVEYRITDFLCSPWVGLNPEFGGGGALDETWARVKLVDACEESLETGQVVLPVSVHKRCLRALKNAKPETEQQMRFLVAIYPWMDAIKGAEVADG